ncbi:MAG: hypothetical protein A2V74_09560 [Acidobacteria bacterium RBG_16_70_10]|nr:MAG: hypothetical protein A2V74_09560 [Acidobacteria bacterium RBG_16_70_10]
MNAPAAFGAPATSLPSTRETSRPREKLPLEIALEALEGRFRTQILWGLFWGARAFSELMRNVPDIPKKVLRRELTEMERLGLVDRVVRPGSNRRAEYSLSPLGRTLRPLVGAMYEWGLLRLRLERRLHRAFGGPLPVSPDVRLDDECPGEARPSEG